MKSQIFKGITAAVVTVSDSGAKGERGDLSGETLVRMLKERGAHVLRKEIIPDRKLKIKKTLVFISDALRIKLILTTGGTGLGPRDLTPEATRSIVDRVVPGLAELMRSEGARTTKRAALSRGLVGTRKNTLIVNLPGSVRGAQESFAAIAEVIPHALAMMRGEGH